VNRKAPDAELRPGNHRLELFSDGVFAIVITIMVLDVRIPASLAFANDAAAMRQVANELVAYALSFLVIANLWTSHHYLLFTITMPARGTVWLNNHLLFWISLIPVATRFLGHFPASSRAAAIYGVIAFGCTGAFMLLRSHAARMTHNDVHRMIHRRVLKRTWLFLAIYAASVPLAFVNVWLAWICFAIVPPMLFLPVIRAPADVGHAAEHRALEHSCP
jgi:uncharacterized membrane protein